MAKLRRGCRRIFLVFVSLFVCAIISTIFNAWMKPQADATRTAEAERGLAAIAMSQATASIIALTPSNTLTATFTPSLTFTPSATTTASYTAIAKRQIIPTNTAVTMNQAVASVVALTPSTMPLPSSTPLPTETPTMTFTSRSDATRTAEVERGLTAIAANIATASFVAPTPTTSTPIPPIVIIVTNPPQVTLTPTVPPFSEAAYVEMISKQVKGQGLDVQLIRVTDGCIKGGTCVVVIGYVTHGTQQADFLFEWEGIFTLTALAIELNGLDVDEVTIVVGDSKGKTEAILVAKYDDLRAYYNSEIDLDEFFHRVHVNTF